MVDYKINFNEYVKVKLTTVGIKELKRQHDEIDLAIRNRGGKGIGEFKVEIDEDGYAKFQFWKLMSTFGHMMTLASEPPFESDIIITNGQVVMKLVTRE